MPELLLPRDNLTRAVPFTINRAADAGDGLTLDGYGAVFDSPTRIDSWEGFFDEVIARGAFAKTLKERTPIVQFDHGHHPLVGSIPIATMQRAEEDDHGLHIVARLADNWLIQPVRDAIANGGITGMSFRFEVVKETLDDSGDVPLRTIQEVKLFEVGPVVWPAYQDTSVGVRSELASLLADPTGRLELARTLLSTPNPAVVQEDETGTGAGEDREPREHSGPSTDARLRTLGSIQRANAL